MIIQLSNDERDLLIDLLDVSIAECRQEIHRTDLLPYKDSIRVRKNVMEDLLGRLTRTEDLSDARNLEYTS